ncbi:MAG: hypothetical protein ACE5KU_02130 [Nitrososphaerales archaeon]
MILLAFLPFTLFFIDVLLIGFRRRVDLIFTTGLVTLLITLTATTLTTDIGVPLQALNTFENAILTWATIQAVVTLIYRRRIADEAFHNVFVLLDGIIIMLTLITLLSTSPSGQITLSPLYILLIFTGYSCTLTAGVHILSDGEEYTGDLLAKAGWALLGAAMVFEIEALIRFLQEEPLGHILQTATFLPWIFLTAYFHSRRLGLWAKRSSIELAVLGLLFSAFITFSGSTSIPFYPSSSIAFILILLSLPFFSLFIRRGRSRGVIQIGTNLTAIWMLLTGLGIYLLMAELLAYLDLLSESYLHTTLFDFYILAGLIASGAILVNNAVKSVKNKALIMIGIAVIAVLPPSIGLIDLNYLTLLIISIVSAASLSAVYAMARRRLRLLSTIGFIIFAALSAIHLGGYITIDTVEVALNNDKAEDINGITVKYSRYEFIGVRGVVQLPERETEVPKQAILLIGLNISAGDLKRSIEVPVIYDILDEVSSRPPLHSDIVPISHGLNDLYISVEPDETMVDWLKSAYRGALIGERFNAPLNTVNISVKQTSFTTLLLIGLVALIMIGAYQLPYSTQNGTVTSQTSSKE